MLGAKISAYSYRRNSRRPDSFDVRIIDVREFPRLMANGQSILRDGHLRRWDPNDLQSFTPLRFAVPSVMGFEGRAVVTDPDCFAVGDVADLLERDTDGKPIFAALRPDARERDEFTSSVMLLDCARLRHWDFDRLLDDLFAKRLDYMPWNKLQLEDRSTIGTLDPEWNQFDTLTTQTKILHTTRRRTQPWKTGLPIDYTLYERGMIGAMRRLWPSRYRPHPDPAQEAFIYSLLAEMIDAGTVTEAELAREMAGNHIRHDSPALIERYRSWRPFSEAA